MGITLSSPNVKANIKFNDESKQVGCEGVSATESRPEHVSSRKLSLPQAKGKWEDERRESKEGYGAGGDKPLLGVVGGTVSNARQEKVSIQPGFANSVSSEVIRPLSFFHGLGVYSFIYGTMHPCCVPSIQRLQ